MTATAGYLFEGADWDFSKLQRIHDACEEIARSELGLDIYPNQIEVITAEQMLDAYSSAGMPLFYMHWSFGKHFAHHEAFYRKGIMGRAYEIVINSSPCISYLMEENTATMQTLVIAHAAFGHNHFFKNNYLFKQWTDAEVRRRQRRLRCRAPRRRRRLPSGPALFHPAAQHGIAQAKFFGPPIERPLEATRSTACRL